MKIERKKKEKEKKRYRFEILFPWKQHKFLVTPHLNKFLKHFVLS